MDSYIIPFVVVSFILTILTAVTVYWLNRSWVTKQVALPQFEMLRAHISRCGLIYPAVSVYWYSGLYFIMAKGYLG